MEENVIRSKITPPEGYELDRENSTLQEIVWKPIKKEKEIEYKDISKILFDSTYYHTDGNGNIIKLLNPHPDFYCSSNNALSKLQLQKMLAYNKLMNIAEYLNEGWKPDWNDRCENKYIIIFDNLHNIFSTNSHNVFRTSEVLFKSKELAKQAIKIMGQEDLNILFNR